uniref:Secreted protein n=1 Tax=Arundo donax TaxID=35708 RepID=A0A0A9D7V3_ARUDO
MVLCLLLTAILLAAAAVHGASFDSCGMALVCAVGRNQWSTASRLALAVAWAGMLDLLCSKPESGRLRSLVLNSTQIWLGPWCARLNPAATACTNGASVVSSGGALHQLNASSLTRLCPCWRTSSWPDSPTSWPLQDIGLISGMWMRLTLLYFDMLFLI